MNIILKRNDKGYKFTYSLVDENGQSINLTGTTVKFQMGDKSRIVINSSAVIEDAANGVVSYTFTDEDTLFNGNFIGEFVVTYSDTKELRYPRDSYIVVNIQLNVDTEATNITVDAVAARQGDFTDKLNAIIANNSSLSEVIDARGGFITLNERLNDKASLALVNTKADKTYVDNTIQKNYLINGNFDVWQRGTSQTSIGYNSDDRWFNSHSGSTKLTGQVVFPIGQTEVPNNPTYFSSTTVTSVTGAGNYVAKWQKIEDVTKLSGKTVTLTFWAKADANRPISVEFVQSFGSGGSAQVNSIGVQKINLTTTWQKYTVTVTLPSVLGKTIGTGSFTQLNFWFDAGSNFNADTNSLGQQSGVFNLAQIQLNDGSVSLPYMSRTFSEELQLCQRYYQTSYDGNGVAQRYIDGNTSYASLLIPLSVTMRTSPTCKLYSGNTNVADKIGSDSLGDVNGLIFPLGKSMIRVYVNNVALTTGVGIAAHYTVDAEL